MVLKSRNVKILSLRLSRVDFQGINDRLLSQIVPLFSNLSSVISIEVKTEEITVSFVLHGTTSSVDKKYHLLHQTIIELPNYLPRNLEYTMISGYESPILPYLENPDQLMGNRFIELLELEVESHINTLLRSILEIPGCSILLAHYNVFGEINRSLIIKLEDQESDPSDTIELLTGILHDMPNCTGKLRVISNSVYRENPGLISLGCVKKTNIGNWQEIVDAVPDVLKTYTVPQPRPVLSMIEIPARIPSHSEISNSDDQKEVHILSSEQSQLDLELFSLQDIVQQLGWEISSIEPRKNFIFRKIRKNDIKLSIIEVYEDEKVEHLSKSDVVDLINPIIIYPGHQPLEKKLEGVDYIKLGDLKYILTYLPL